MARLSGRCTEPCEYCHWLSSTDKVAYGTTSAQQSFSWTYGWQLADSMFFPINPRSGWLGPHAPGTICGGGQLRKTRACRNQPPSGRGGRRHWKEREWWVIKTNARTKTCRADLDSLYVACMPDTNRHFHDSGHGSSNILPSSLSQPSHRLCPQLASWYLSPSGGSLWPAVSPVFSHCWFRLEARMLPLARGMSSRLVLIIPPHFNGKPARHAGFTNSSCRILSQLFNLWKDLADRSKTVFEVFVIWLDNNECLMSWYHVGVKKKY